MSRDSAIRVGADAIAHSNRVAQHLLQRIDASDGWLPFSQWMGAALYAPGLGYYAAGSPKFAARSDTSGSTTSGDFVTAPMLTPLFGRTLAAQVAQILRACESLDVLEFGAGSGECAADILGALDALGISARYHILEVSADLRDRQQRRLAAWGSRVTWLTQAPSAFTGCILANEVLDAMPVVCFRWSDDGTLLERGVARSGDQFVWSERPASHDLARAMTQRMPALPGYQSEINLQAEAWTRAMGSWLTRGAALLIDYGFPRREYYHPQRHRGTLMCHIQHRAHDDVFLAPGLQDITAHVDFTAIADAALEGGLEVLGYISQARFLINAGLPEAWNTLMQEDPQAQAREGRLIEKLISEAEMGELFKVMAIGRGIDEELIGFSRGDRTAQL